MSITITQQPAKALVFTNDNAVFTVVAEGEGLTYQWQHHTATGTSWMDTSSTGSTTDTMTIKAQSYRNRYGYRCKITDASGEVAYTDEVLLIIVDTDSDKGLVSLSYMTDIGDAIREKTETTDKIVPADMAAMIRGIEGREIFTGYITGTGSISTYSLGVSLPVYDKYCFVVMPVNVSRYCGFKMVLGTITCDYCFTAAATREGGWNINFENGTIKNQYFTPAEGETFKWWYFEEKVG